MVGPGVPCKIKLSDELWSASQKRSTSAKWRFFPRRRRSVATKLLTAHHVVRDGMTGLTGGLNCSARSAEKERGPPLRRKYAVPEGTRESMLFSPGIAMPGFHMSCLRHWSRIVAPG